MTAVPLPDNPTLRVSLVYTDPSGGAAGSRFFLNYAGSAPTGANCTTIATDIAAAWQSDMAGMIHPDWQLVEVDVLDIATESGLSGHWTGSYPGTRTGTQQQQGCATNVEFDIGRRYRGGKPRMYWPPGNFADTNGANAYTTGYASAMNTAVGNFFAAVQAISVGTVGALSLVCLSYYKGFTNITNSSGRTRAVPTYRATALSERIVGYATKLTIGSQRRRRTSTTP